MAAGRSTRRGSCSWSRPRGGTPGLDAEVHIGEGTPGEVVVIRLRGAVAKAPGLGGPAAAAAGLPRRHLVAGQGSARPGAADELAQLAMRRITDAAAAPRPLRRAQGPREGLLARRHRSELDPADPVAGAAGRRPGPVPGQGQPGRRV